MGLVSEKHPRPMGRSRLWDRPWKPCRGDMALCLSPSPGLEDDSLGSYFTNVVESCRQPVRIRVLVVGTSARGQFADLRGRMTEFGNCGAEGH